MSPARRKRLRIVVLGYIVRGPLGGMAWHHFQYVLGLQRLGHEVHYFERGSGECCYDPRFHAWVAEPGYGLRFAAHLLDGVPWGFEQDGALHGIRPTGADVLLNLSGINDLVGFENVPVRALVDTDPVFTQLRGATDSHTSFFTFGENAHNLPDGGRSWQPTRQPVVLEAWPVTRGHPRGRWTTVMAWEAYPPAVLGGRRLGLKSHSFEPYVDLPRSSNARLELALGADATVKERLQRHGWRLRNPLELVTPRSFQRYIRESKGEWSVAKEAYVAMRSGWFSERTTGYLASGRPAVVQETGFSDVLPSGDGVLPFATVEEATSALAEADRRYGHHCRAARRMVEEYFDSTKVLKTLLERALD